LREGREGENIMLLAADIGNTQTVFGLYEGTGEAAALKAHWRIATDAADTADELAVKLHGLMSVANITANSISAVCLASVVPPLTEQYIKLGYSLTNTMPLVVTAATATGLAIDYANPAEIGADRIADAVAAIALYGAPVIVVDFGTATNIEVVRADGAFVGGIIAPGLQASAEALFAAAARLAKVDIAVPPKAIGTSTREAVQSGLTYGEIDRVDGLVRRVFAELGLSEQGLGEAGGAAGADGAERVCPVVATGGLSSRVVALSSTITCSNDDLTLEGLRLIYEMQ
jgi:type III pantothenate kinase